MVLRSLIKNKYFLPTILIASLITSLAGISYSENISLFFTSGQTAITFDVGPPFVFVIASQEMADFTLGAPPTTKSGAAFVLISSPLCSDFVTLTSADWSWSMAQTDVNVNTACGSISITWVSSGPGSIQNDIQTGDCSETTLFLSTDGSTNQAIANGNIGTTAVTSTNAFILDGESSFRICG